ncbi:MULTISPECIES: FKBP-type peptidyl-prolyl cis-trans isomerase [unclassified Achromobacter]|uniref:FKBP-type peptidyl-prolyl cis-trans isomerase n=1 Tax=unclassified Achromobacter TaxID=2626865 RepID=UPI000B51A03A|nr:MULTISPECIES: FKBP-type peptidyl-prolyl cis-trans isomerase [unclassified Achromobacter]OWT77299.1 peptidylprolyl isomerase [Achromobacter sp. HZ28]OWT78180.1 peptidylprolyl isomerase [Achromobacter sp. HZ34]
MMKSRLLFAAAALAFAAAGQAQSNVQTLPSGVRVETITAGKGMNPTASSTVTVNYRGTLTNGTEFDSSYKRNEPISFSLSQVIPCWTEGIQKMAVGGKAVLYCPAKTAYGSRGAGGVIPPNADLKFEVELIGVR